MKTPREATQTNLHLLQPSRLRIYLGRQTRRGYFSSVKRILMLLVPHYRGLGREEISEIRPDRAV